LAVGGLSAPTSVLPVVFFLEQDRVLSETPMLFSDPCRNARVLFSAAGDPLVIILQRK